jgi:2-polyprenyl-3-methyl-5-hydroxy-6-metoxy-1,4-benzoquinol methylase
MDNYNAFADIYNDSERDAVTLWSLGYRIVIEFLGDVNGKSVLDYGCGTGTFCRFIQSKGAIVTGVDISENMIRVAQSINSGSIDYFTITDKGLDFLNDSMFDLVVSNFVLCTLPSMHEISLILRQIYHVLKKEGMFVMMNSNWDKSNGKEFVSYRLEYCKNLVSGHPVTAIIKSNPLIRLHDYFYPIEEYRKMLMEAGFWIKDQREEIAESDNALWLDEKKYPPYYAISAIK